MVEEVDGGSFFRAVTLVGALVVSAGEIFSGPLTKGWGEESRLLHEFYAHAADAYNIHVESVWTSAGPSELDFRKSWQGDSGIAILTAKDGLFAPVLGAEDLQTHYVAAGVSMSLADLMKMHSVGPGPCDM